MKCFYHPDRHAVNTCSKCGQHICSECNYVTGTDPVCRNCWDKQLPAHEAALDSKPAKTVKPEKSAGRNKTAVGILLITLITIGIIGYWFANAIQQPDSITETLLAHVQQNEQADYVAQTLPAYVYQFNGQPPTPNASGEPVSLVNNPDAKDVSFAELKSFILEDDTNEHKYIVGVRNCVDFAEMLHNNAEEAGIRAAFVGINFAVKKIGHAINAFQTTDMGLVYVDCTGPAAEDFAHKDQYDMIGYIERFEKYGTISISKARNLHYTFYREYGQKMRRSPFVPMDPVDTIEIWW